MIFLKSLIMTFNMYTKIPMPQTAWNEKYMKYVLSLFPIVGLVEGIIYVFLWKFMIFIKLSPYITAAVLTAFPMLYTGGIHMDGFLDTSDALGSHQSREKKLDILKDSHIGAGAVISGLVYIMFYAFTILSITRLRQVVIIAFSFFMIRAYSALSLVCFKNARGSGLAMTFTKASDLLFTRILLISFIAAAKILSSLYFPRAGIAVSITVFICFFYFRLFICGEFGGVTGDLAGFFLQMAELAAVIVTAVA
ncbi:cobalamin-5-phosphate synthase [Johnsonella ignava ATCC 51276]|uniref:Adenosylcobinamide-GDP ribazoletransferase n=1 Tax=Johnsonella ignava ATCC 51276 TaxID=679200 RepID=G5GKP6_9FIRM|nr:adenosylcobinamide-GDP ribazoletransferase [Johnsonella ignava]EHI54680.1 cobalamin-5-phosphate synthase [Johnsonella ignava ATCC 51276]